MKITGLVVFLFVLLPVCLPAQSEIDHAKSAGSDMGNLGVEKFGSTDSFKSNISDPVTSENTLMKTLDGASSFKGQLSCPSSSRFLEVFVQPGGSGDLQLVRISQDIDLDGNVDFVTQLPFPVSGICGNGVITCDTGTWDNCRYYKWGLSDSGQLLLNEVGVTALGGCYCINTACGSGLVWQNLDVVLRDLGGGIVGAIQARTRRYAVADAKIDSTLITYYGQDVKKCARSGTAPSGTSPSKFYDPQSDAALLGAAESEVVSQSGDPGSLYSLMINSPAMSETAGDLRSCRITRSINILKSFTCPDDGSYDSGTQLCIIPANDYTPRTFSTGGGGGYCYFGLPISPEGGDTYGIGNGLCGDPQGGIVKNARIIYTCGGVQHIIYTAEYQAVTFPPCPSRDARFVQGLYYTTPAGSIDCSHYEGATPIAGEACSKPPDKKDEVQESVADGCSAMEADASCKIREERVDDVYTYRNYSPTRVLPVATCKTFTGNFDHNVCRDWWVKERTYYCKSAKRYDFTDAKARADAVVGSIAGSPSTGQYRFRDITKSDTGAWSTMDMSLDLSMKSAMAPKPCEDACRTRRRKLDTQAGVSGVRTNYQKDNVSHEFLYHRCENGVCPAGPGEEILKDCQCMNDFAEAATVMSVVDDAGKDIICTTGQKY
ncbi:MAG: hypothetical protein ACE14T_03945 [Syntrophales bacterium]